MVEGWATFRPSSRYLRLNSSCLADALPLSVSSQGVFPSVFLGGLGLLGAAYLSARLDSLYNDNKERLDEFEWEVEERLDKLEESQDESKKEDKKLDFKAKALCKLASLFNNPTYDICSDGFDAGEIVGPSGYSRDGQYRSFPESGTMMVPQLHHPANE